MTPSATTTPQTLSRSLIWLMTISAGAIVANIYYAQSLLVRMGQDLAAPESTMGTVAMLTQVGVALGMLFFVPMGDKFNRRTLICILASFASMFLLAIAVAPNVALLAIACFGVGVAGSAVHVIIPFAAHLAPAAQRGRVVGTVLSGLLIGILTARTFSGFLGTWLGWRSVYFTASAAMLLLAFTLYFKLPDSLPDPSLSFAALFRSIWQLVREHRELRQASFTGAMLFGAFSAFWTTIAFLLAARPYHYGPSATGLFGLLGAAGAAAAPIVGGIADRRGPRIAVFWSVMITIGSFAVLLAGATKLALLIAGVVLMDLGVQSGHVANQTRIYAIAPNARSRLNTAYMFSYFVGGAFGSLGGTVAWEHARWTGVCLFAAAMLAATLPGLLRGRVDEVAWASGGPVPGEVE